MTAVPIVGRPDFGPCSALVSVSLFIYIFIVVFMFVEYFTGRSHRHGSGRTGWTGWTRSI